MDKLELKHIIDHAKYNGGLRCLDDDNLFFDDEIKIIDFTNGYIETKEGVIIELSDFGEKVFLVKRPLSDVKKVITIDGCSFDPEEELNYEFGDCETFYSFDGDKLIEDIYRTENAIHNKHIYPNPNCYPGFIVQLLIEWGFDLDYLIKSGLAIDINTLES